MVVLSQGCLRGRGRDLGPSVMACRGGAVRRSGVPPTSALVFGDSKVVDYFRFSSFIKAFHA